MRNDGQTRRSSLAFFVTRRTRLKQTVIKATAAADYDERSIDGEILVTGTQKSIFASLLILPSHPACILGLNV